MFSEMKQNKHVPAKGAELETQLSGEDPKGFVDQWVKAANNAQGQATKISAEPSCCNK